MLIDAELLWRHWARERLRKVSHALHLYSRIAYLYWVAANITGAALVMPSRAGT